LVLIKDIYGKREEVKDYFKVYYLIMTFKI